jgi:diadenosine tetraphosphate (Ap4A) HIT family hydrolase
VVIGDHQFFKGYTVFICKEHETELHFLKEDFKNKFLSEMSKVAEAVYNAFKPDKLNYELLGNGDTHIHWHIFPRREKDTPEKGPVWWLDRNIMFSDETKPTEKELDELRMKLYNELEKLIKPIS